MLVDKETGWVEPTITINGRELTFAEAMCLRVAVSSFLMFLSAPESRAGLGEHLANGYQASLEHIECLMRGNAKE